MGINLKKAAIRAYQSMLVLGAFSGAVTISVGTYGLTYMIGLSLGLPDKVASALGVISEIPVSLAGGAAIWNVIGPEIEQLDYELYEEDRKDNLIKLYQ